MKELKTFSPSCLYYENESFNASFRADEPGLPGNSGDDMTDQTNRDNIVEVGP